MNQKGLAQGYARILDRVAGNQVPKDLDLALHIMNRIQKQKGCHMQPRMKFFAAAGLVAMVIIVMVSTVPGIAAAIGRWFGYVPGIGFVQEGQIRILVEPVSASREGITITVDQVVLDPERTSLVYSVAGIPITAMVTNPLDQRCPYKASLQLPDGTSLQASPDGIQYWASGYQHRFHYPPVHASTNDATLIINCLFNTRPGAAPEDWKIPLHFVPAPPDFTAFPVIEIPTPTAPLATPTTVQTTQKITTENAAALTETPPQPIFLSLTLDRAVQMDDGYLIYATVHWKDTPFTWVDVTDPQATLHLLDANGQPMAYELRNDEQTRIDVGQHQTVFAIKTAPVQAPGPLTLVLDSVFAELPVDANFEFNPGHNPQPGQTWKLDQEIQVGQYHLRVRSATAGAGGYDFIMSSDNGIVNATLFDRALSVGSGGGGGGGSDGNPGDTFSYHLNYGNQRLPDGPLVVSVSSISVKQVQRLEAKWTPPAASITQLPTQGAACLTTAAWQAALAQKPSIPNGLSGRILISGQLDQPKSDKWSVAIFSLNGMKQQVIQDAHDGAISPDGSKLVYSTLEKGLGIMDLATNQTSPIPGTGNGDFNPLWSPDGKLLVFNRGMGIFDLFIVDPDGANIRQITHGGAQEWPVGWLPDGRLLYMVPGRENESTNYAVDVQSGKSEIVTEDSLLSVSQDGKYILTSEKTFGDRWQVYYSELNGTNRRLLNDSDLWILTSVWSPDGQWLLANVADTDPARSIIALINLSTCQVVPLPYLRGNLLSWTP